MLVGWWLAFCLIVSTGFKSSLIAHLTVQEKTQPMETLRDLFETDGWRWAMDPLLLNSGPGKFFSQATDPMTMEINKRMEVSVKIMLQGA